MFPREVHHNFANRDQVNRNTPPEVAPFHGIDRNVRLVPQDILKRYNIDFRYAQLRLITKICMSFLQESKEFNFTEHKICVPAAVVSCLCQSDVAEERSIFL